MYVTLSDKNKYKIMLVKLADDLDADGYQYVNIEHDGELTIARGELREVWQMQPPGVGTDNTQWGDAPNGYEFIRSYTINEGTFTFKRVLESRELDHYEYWNKWNGKYYYEKTETPVYARRNAKVKHQKPVEFPHMIHTPNNEKLPALVLRTVAHVVVGKDDNDEYIVDKWKLEFHMREGEWPRKWKKWTKR